MSSVIVSPSATAPDEQDATPSRFDASSVATARNVAPPPSGVALGRVATPPRVFLPLPGSDEMPRRRWTKDEYYRLLDVGIFEDREPCELIEGEIIAKMGQGMPHVIAVMLLQELLRAVFGPFRVMAQAPVIADEYNVPEPDLLVLREVATQYRETPAASDALLAVEISRTTQRRDRGIKAVIYARAGIPDYWILAPAARTLTVLRESNAEGYASETTYTETETVAPLSAPDAVLLVSAMLQSPAGTDDVAEPTTEAGA